MSIEAELSNELKDAMRAGDRPRRDVIRQVQTEVTMVKSSPGFSGGVTDDTYRMVIGSYSKKMQKAIEEYRGLGERGAAMADKLTFEVDYLSRWLPKKLDDDATTDLIEATIARLGVAGDPKSAGQGMASIGR
jgi:uncharacterized protein